MAEEDATVRLRFIHDSDKVVGEMGANLRKFYGMAAPAQQGMTTAPQAYNTAMAAGGKLVGMTAQEMRRLADVALH
jgi:hypothetical protein